jgi:sigma-70-like protein/anti-sigma-K factor RskA
MATFDKLSDQQRAIIELVLRQGKSYAELAEMLDMPEGRVRELARDALVDLAPISARRVEEDWRGQLADYLLNQQSGPEATATRGHLRRSEGARAWAASVLDSLDHLYGDEPPQIPEPERGGARRREPAAAAATARRSRGLPADRGKLLAGGGVLVAALLVAVLVWPIGVLTGDDDEGGNGGGGEAAANQNGGQNAATGEPAGVAVVASEDGKRQLVVQAASLEPSNQRQAYEVWLYNSPEDAKSIGAQVTDQNGNYQGAGPLPSDYRRYRFIDVSREPIDRNRDHSGESVLRGRMPTLRQAQQRGNQPAILGQTVLSPPSG